MIIIIINLINLYFKTFIDYKFYLDDNLLLIIIFIKINY